MKEAILNITLFILLFFFSTLAWADNLDDLKKQIQELKTDYESKIEKLQAQIETLSKHQEEKVSQIEEKLDKKILNVEYVGRYEGPFGKGGLLIKNPSGFGNVSVGGYADIEFENFKDSNSTFDQARFILNVGAIPHEKLLFYSEYEIEHGGPNAPGGGGEAKVEQAWISYLINNWINLRGGIVLVPFGKFNLLHDSDIQDLTERPLVSRRLLAATWMEAGMGLFGEFELGEVLNWKLFPDAYINYEGYVINGLDEDISDTGMRNAKGSLSSDTNNNKAFVSRLGLGLNRNLELGLSTYTGRYGRSGNATRNGKDNLVGLGGDLNFKRGPFELVGDFAYFDFEEGALVDQDDDNTTAAVSAPKYMRGFYIEPRFHFWPKFLNNTYLGQGFKDPKLTLVSRYDWVDIGDDGDAGGNDNKEKRFTLGLNYRPIESWVFKLEYQWNRSTNETLERGDKNGMMASMAMGF
ncbi:MAG: porin [Candidatus Omnitrophota bacterium]